MLYPGVHFGSKSRPKDDVSLMVLLESENKYFLHIQEGAKDWPAITSQVL